MNGHHKDQEDVYVGGNQEDLEMAPLHAPHKSEEDDRTNERSRRTSDSDNDDDDDPYVGESASSPFLGAHQRTRGPERISRSPGLWPQIKGIVSRFVEAAPTLMFTTVGLLFTGELLDRVSRWPAMQRADQLIMIIPVVLNLKGNLEMNLSARLGTAANTGLLDDPPTRRSMIIGNLALLQVQAAVVSFVAACLSLVLGMIVPKDAGDAAGETGRALSMLAARSLLGARRPLPAGAKTAERKSGLPTFILVAATATCSAALSAAILGSFMSALVVLCRRLALDPDNIAPPVASCLGDLVTLILIGLVSAALLPFLTAPLIFGVPVVPLLVFLAVVACALGCLTAVVRQNPHAAPLLSQGWGPLFGAMIISSATGIVLDLFVSRYEDFAVLAVVISGLPGSVGAIFTSRLSTQLHAAAEGRGYEEKAAGPPARTVAMTLLLITLPVELVFLAVVRGLGWLQLPLLFVGSSILFFCAAVCISLVLAYHLTSFLWARGMDPDMNALPLHSSLMDLVGQLLLVLCFEVVSLLGVKVETRE
ncbi:hypothetical protein BD626DRAFT_513632 [Schizophyllum amplum]|uniref:SLC41A/MgtE integral membrane domain-containing protein n=1 Tax=Schizophyllum amplum TaxID=97359 RepID=A0A550BZ46_9AGAR|nr:hypothetical protein BD626DRAFT_513632 [Auriculariopsis ampla]